MNFQTNNVESVAMQAEFCAGIAAQSAYAVKYVRVGTVKS